MNKHHLLRKISVIHAIKCNRTLSFDEATASFNRLNDLKEKVVNADENEQDEITKLINDWAAENPVASDAAIKSLMNK